MASSLKVNRIVPSTGTNIGLGTASGEIRLAGTSKLTWDGDTNTYINHPSADTITAFTAGSERLRINSAGKVGIGSVTPGATLDLRSSDTEILLRLNTKPVKNGYLDIVSDANRRGVIRFQDTDGTYRWSIGKGDSDELSNTSFHISSGNSGGNAAKLVITSGGKVGINSTSPTYALEVDGGTQNTVIAVHSSDTRSQISFLDNATSGYGHVAVGCEGDDLFIRTGSGSKAITIKSGGELLVGGHSSTINPDNYASSVQVHGTATDAGISILRYSNNSNGPTLLFGKSRGTSIGAIGEVQDGDSLGKIEFYGTDTNWESSASIRASADGEWYSGSAGSEDNTDAPGRLEFYTTPNGADNLAERFRITNAGTSYFGLPDVHNFQPEAQVNIISHKDMNSDKDDASGYHLVLKNPNNDTGEAVGLGFAITDTANKIGAVIAHKRTAAGSTGELSFYVRHANGSAPTRRLRIGPEGGVTIGSIDNGFANSLLVQAGVYISAYNGDNLITNASQGGGASTLYIGNQAIQMSSDKRIKKNIVDTTTNVLDKIKQVRVVDFDWDDPSDTASVNRNSRGKWTGCLAQEMVDIFPHVINAPRKEDNSLDYDSDRTWLVDYGHLVPTLIKGMQEQQKQIEELKAEVSSLKSS